MFWGCPVVPDVIDLETFLRVAKSKPFFYTLAGVTSFNMNYTQL